MPQGWQQIYFWLQTDNEAVADNEVSDLVLRLYTKHGVKDNPFTVINNIEDT